MQVQALAGVGKFTESTGGTAAAICAARGQNRPSQLLTTCLSRVCWLVSGCVQLLGVGVDELVKRGLLDACKQVRHTLTQQCRWCTLLPIQHHLAWRMSTSHVQRAATLLLALCLPRAKIIPTTRTYCRMPQGPLYWLDTADSQPCIGELGERFARERKCSSCSASLSMSGTARCAMTPRISCCKRLLSGLYLWVSTKLSVLCASPVCLQALAASLHGNSLHTVSCTGCIPHSRTFLQTAPPTLGALRPQHPCPQTCCVGTPANLRPVPCCRVVSCVVLCVVSACSCCGVVLCVCLLPAARQAVPLWSAPQVHQPS